MNVATSVPGSGQPVTMLRDTGVHTDAVVDVWAALGVGEDETTSLFAVDPATGRTAAILASVAEHRGVRVEMDGLNVYFGVNPVREGISYGRGTEADVTRVVALWADLDVKSLISLQNCEAVVEKLTGVLGVRPVATIYSGHGVQPLWRVADPVTFTDHAQRTIWKNRLARWGGLVQHVADEVSPGARVDSVFDLARVLRCPGSVNNKHTRPDGSGAVAVSTVLACLTEAIQTTALDAALHTVTTTLRAKVPPVRAKAAVQEDEILNWIRSRPGWDAPRDAMYMQLYDHVEYEYLLARFSLQGEDASVGASAHEEMIRRVDHAVRCAQEGSPGLRMALQLIEQAYLEIMQRRRAGALTGDPRSDYAATADVSRAVQGSVRAAIAREMKKAPAVARFRKSTNQEDA